MEEPTNATYFSEPENLNWKKRSHRRSQSNDSAGSSSKEGNKPGRIRRKLHWSMKELLTSTALVTIDSGVSVGSAEHTCATETTVHSPISLSHTNPSNKNSSTRSNDDREEDLPQSKRAGSDSLAFMDTKTGIFQKRGKPKRQHALSSMDIDDHQHGARTITGGATAMPKLLAPPRASTGTRQKLIPRISHRFLVPQLSSRSLMAPSSTNSEPERIRTLDTSPSTPITFKMFEDDSSNASSLTPIPPTKLSFNDFVSPSLPALNNDALAVSNDDIEFSHSLESRSFFSNEISVVLFPTEDNQLSNVSSPLTPSPRMSSPPLRRHDPKPRPFVLERILSESNCVVNPNNTTNQDKQLFSAQNDGSTDIDTNNDVSPDQTEDAAVSNNPDEILAPVGQGKRHERTANKSVPVDVDDVRFIDLEENMEVIGKMAEDLLQRGEYDEALDVLKEMLRGNVEMFGYEHESVGVSLHSITSAQMKRRRFDKAIQSGQKAVEVRKLALGGEHLDVAASLVLLGLSYFEHQHYGLALESFLEALKIRRKGLGVTHVKVAKVLNNVACTLKALGRLGEALDVFAEALSMQRELLASMAITNVEGNEGVLVQLSLSIASTQSNICTVKLSLRLIDEALEALDETYQIQCEILGVDHPEVQETRKGIEYICTKRSKRDLSEAIENTNTNDNESSSLIPAMLAYCQPTENALRNMRIAPEAPEVVRLSI